jgi:hypothetical protein
MGKFKTIRISCKQCAKEFEFTCALDSYEVAVAAVEEGGEDVVITGTFPECKAKASRRRIVGFAIQRFLVPLSRIAHHPLVIHGCVSIHADYFSSSRLSVPTRPTSSRNVFWTVTGSVRASAVTSDVLSYRKIRISCSA